MWAAVDCPSGSAILRYKQPDEIVLLGELSVVIETSPSIGSTYQVIAEAAGADDRRLTSKVAIVASDGANLARGRATWVRVDPREPEKRNGMSRRGIFFTPMETRRDAIIQVAVLADRLGFDTIAVPEAWALDSTVVLTEIAIKTKRIRPMSAVLSIWGRTPATIAMSASRLAGVSGSRYVPR